MSLNKYLVFSRDPGGAEILSRFIKNENIQNDCLFILEGPAKSIFLNVLSKFESKTVEDAESIFSSFNIQKIFCSTSGHDGPEKTALKLSKIYNVESIALIDHWTNFAERFQIPEVNEMLLPQRIYYTDEIQSELLISLVNGQTQLTKIPNFYLEELQKDFDSKIKKKQNTNSILFLDEPIKDDSKELHLEDYGYDEYSAFKFFLENVDKVCPSFDSVIIRLHPRSLKNKYDEIISHYKVKIKYSNHSNLVDDLIESKAVFGCTTMALIVSSICNIETFSTIPVENILHGLPSKKIKYLRELK